MKRSPTWSASEQTEWTAAVDRITSEIPADYLAEVRALAFELRPS